MARAKGAGGKLNKSETVQVRFDPILKMAAELAAAQERRTLSSYTEWAVERAVKQTSVARDETGNAVDAFQVAKECWHSQPSQQLTNLLHRYPDLLTIRERKIIEAMKLVDDLWKDSDTDAEANRALAKNELWIEMCQYADDVLTFRQFYAKLLQEKSDIGHFFERGYIGKEGSDS